MKSKRNIALIGVALAMAFVSALGVYAVATDTANSGTFNVTSASQAGSTIDLKISSLAPPTADVAQGPCSGPEFGTMVDSATTPYMDETHDFLTPFVGHPAERYFCLSNVGTVPAVIRAEMINVSNTETGCTGDEADVDATCGTAGTSDGELGASAALQLTRGTPAGTAAAATCTFSNPSSITYNPILANVASQLFAGTGGSLTLGAGQTVCMVASMDIRGNSAFVKASQSDKLSFQFKFHGDVS